ncbi:DUF1217 domain-containing protein [Paragemmobacter ruber]|uniref:DUF1217 domain-containing protein n=1 Tax=Paragemmobacter ruber TaxID=1985673 RepID=A0ABW9Y4F5_9RHOB|nr:DUF1217 domain-containing protein [Rhodobacter ruber]NBE07389.1 DUF1217 domain-containing protein [Rhodobacter ruber]
MTFQPLVPLSGPGGWSFLKRTEAMQSATFARQPAIQRDEAYFRGKIGSVRTAEALVNDRRLLRITLEAFGLEADVNARAFIRKVLEDGTLRQDALANRLTDKRYLELSSAFGFGDFSVPRTVLSDFPGEVMTRWKQQRFETAVGGVDGNLRLALNARRELASLAAGSSSETTKWLRILGDAPLSTVMRGALNLPRSTAALDLDQQLSAMRSRAAAVFGADTISQFKDSSTVERLIQRFLVTASFGEGSGSANSALTLLQQSRSFLRRL